MPDPIHGDITTEDYYDLIETYNRRSKHLDLGRFNCGSGTSPAYIGESDPDPGRVLEDIHSQYIRYADSRQILFSRCDGPIGSTGMEYKAHRYVVRGTQEYRRRQMGRLSAMRDRWMDLRLPKGTMIRVSTRQVGSIYQHFLSMKILWPAFMDALRHRYAGSIYIWGCEPTKRGYLHFHILTARMFPHKMELRRWVREWWRDHGGDINMNGAYVEPVRKDAISYVMKYVTKTCEDRLWMAILWLSRRRSWGASRPLAGGPTGPHRLTQNIKPLTLPLIRLWERIEWWEIGLLRRERDLRRWKIVGVLPTPLIADIITDKPALSDVEDLLKLLAPRRYTFYTG